MFITIINIQPNVEITIAANGTLHSCVVSYFIVLYCIVLYCIVLYCIDKVLHLRPQLIKPRIQTLLEDDNLDVRFGNEAVSIILS